MTKHLLIIAALGLATPAAALAQSYNAPAGIPAATAPGGLEGRAAPSNLFGTRGADVRVESPYGAVDELATGSVQRRQGGRGVDRR